ncbi:MULTISPECIES: LacI family DNA-binding transcriptional regulator [unclassified Caulobacter]|uniref:LacI family DNA-binding transcriptional regulator n=1 Tax=unclassified Caulobacter TaxID=2648921 RepID=UPI000D3DC452|nr:MULTISPECIES: LacI family DNA-binding transcriptional regulator [unclassified Caulobacter]PTS88148.1 LacI family transcriptional regulator [Caulobacter sp. HMWF009]PTT06656.1 LacI family transcriptional regulator [Caulobacter sp. HMWF025]PTT75122.1 LacI family transcriptional regulator [Pseudomonas sp. HMWF010]
MRATIKDVSALAGVSTKTVSRVLNREKYVSEDLRQRVEGAMAQLNFQPSAAARMLAGKRSHQIALVYGSQSPHYIHQIQTGIWARCVEEGVRLLAQPSDADSPDLALEVGSLIDQTQVDGVILSAPVTDSEAALDELDRRRMPYVRISPGTDHGRSSSVSMDDVQAADDMTSHLIALGHKRIGFIIGHTNHAASDLRLFGYRRALDRAGLAYEPRYVRQGYFDFASGEAAAEMLLDLPNAPTAIFASNDDMAAGVLAVAHRRGLALPEQLSVAGFDDIALAGQIWPPLTTVRQPTREMAYAAAALLFEGVEGPVHRRIAHELVLRASTAAPGA